MRKGGGHKYNNLYVPLRHQRGNNPRFNHGKRESTRVGYLLTEFGVVPYSIETLLIRFRLLIVLHRRTKPQLHIRLPARRFQIIPYAHSARALRPLMRVIVLPGGLGKVAMERMGTYAYSGV
jgi:hypothetical protein